MTGYSTKQLTELAPQTAVVIDEDGNTSDEDVDFIDPGDMVLIKTGNQVPVDGTIKTGTAVLNEASITGESRLVKKHPGDAVFAGTILENGTVTVNTTAAGEDTTFGKIIELVEEAQDSQAKTQRFIDRFARYYTPVVLLVAIMVGLITRDVRLAITVMVLGCPGALVIGVPASTVAGIGNGARQGILFKGSSDHPLAQAISKLDRKYDYQPTDIQTIKGQGIRAQIGEGEYLLGNPTLIKDLLGTSSTLDQLIDQLTSDGNSIVIFASMDHHELAIFGIKDQLRSQAQSALRQLKALGVKRLIMLTGDNEGTAHQIAANLPIDEVHAAMLPQGKADYLKQQQADGHRIAFIGDGINDSPALSAADVAVAMGSGTDVAMDVADLVLVKSDLNSLVTSFRLARRTITNMNENILIALLTVVLLFIGLFVGYIEMASGMLIHELSILIVILNSMRLMKRISQN